MRFVFGVSHSFRMPTQLSRTIGVIKGKGLASRLVMDLFVTLLETAGIVLLVVLSLGGFAASAAWALALVVGRGT